VEVKTRSSGNWDAGGLLSITPRKQAKLWQTARYFLTTYPNLADYPCRFDVALVHYRKLANNQPRQLPKTPPTIETATSLSSMPFQIGEAIIVAGYQLVLQEYIPSAFD
jgi:putative endonuclease